jgi:predicted NBD/HSP70 family sugar kinase
MPPPARRVPAAPGRGDEQGLVAGAGVEQRLLRQAAQARRGGRLIRAAGLMRLLADRDPGTLRVVSDAAELVGQQLAVVCNLLAPDRVVLVGAMAGTGEVVLGPIRTALQRNIAPNEPPALVLGALGTRHTALGAIALALDATDWLPVPERTA